MLTSKLITEIIENHPELCVCANSCNKFVSSRSWWIMKLLKILLCKGSCAPVALPWIRRFQGERSPQSPLRDSPLFWRPCGRSWLWRTTSSKLFAWVQCKSAPIIVILVAFTCLATMLTSKLKIELIESYSEFYVCANSCNKFAPNWSW